MLSQRIDTFAAPRIVFPPVGEILAPEEEIITWGTGTNVSWTVDVLDDGGLQPIAQGTGRNIRFTCPLDFVGKEVEIRLAGDYGSTTQRHLVSIIENLTIATRLPTLVRFRWFKSRTTT